MSNKMKKRKNMERKWGGAAAVGTQIQMGRHGCQIRCRIASGGRNIHEE
jgi:hypothetical protein